MAEPIRIKVTASADASWDRVFGNVTGAARKARKDVAKETDGIGADLAKGIKGGADKAEAAYDKMVAGLMSGGGKMMDPGTRAIKDFVTETKSNFGQAKGSFDELARDAEKSMARVKKAQDDAAKGGKNTFGKSAAGAGKAAFGVGREVARFGLSVADDLARGAGVDTDFGSVVKKNNDVEDLAVALSNQSVIKGDARNSKRIDPKELVAQARQVGMDTGQDASGVLAGMNSFVAKTGDLATARDSMAGLAKLSKATGTSMEDMVSAAGDYSLALGDVPDKGQKIVDMMTRAAAEGKRGSLPIAEMADKMAQLSGAAVQYGGDVQKNTQMMIAMAQMARMGGGADTAAKQTSAVMGFTATFGKGQRLDAFKAAGIETNDKTGRILDPQTIILNALKATGKDPKNQTEAMGKLFASVPAQRVTNAALLTYRNAGGGDAGLEAVRKQMDDLANATLDVKEINESFGAAMDTNSSKANVFNTQMSIVAEQVQGSFTPALIAATPAILGLAGAAAKFIAKITGSDNPDDVAAQSGLKGVVDARTALTQAGATTDKDGNPVGQVDDNSDAANKARAALAQGEKSLADQRNRAAADKAAAPGGWGDVLGAIPDMLTGGGLLHDSWVAENRKSRTQYAQGEQNVADTTGAQVQKLHDQMTGAGINVHIKSMPTQALTAAPGVATPQPK